MWSYHLRTNKHKNNTTTQTDDDGVEIVKSAFQQRIITYKVITNNFYVSVVEYMNEIMFKTVKLIEDEVEKHTCIKINLELFGLYLNPNDESHHVKSFNTPFRVICSSSNIMTDVDEMIQIIDRKADEMAERDSGNLLFYNTYINL